MQNTRRPKVVTSLVAAAVLLAITTVTILLLALADAREGDRHVDRIRARSVDELVTSADDIDAAAQAFRRANGRLRSPLLAPARVLPVIGRQLASAERITATAAQLSAAIARIASVAEPRISSGNFPAGAERLELLGELRAEVRRARETIAAADLGPRRGLVHRVAEERNRASRLVREADEALGRADAALTGLASLLDGPRTYLLLAANNAEMRAGSGMALSAGRLVVEDGAIRLGEMVPTGELVLEQPVAVAGDLEARWGWTELGADFRDLALSPRFPANAELASQMWQVRTGEMVDGVLVVDVRVLEALMGATGDVAVGERTLTFRDVRDFVLHDQYVEFDASFDAGQSERRDALGAIASEVVASLEGDVDGGALIDRMADAAAGRHLLAWSRHSVEQAAWKAMGVDGELESNSVGVHLLNRGGNKLDRFLRLEVDLDVSGAGPGRTVTLTARMENSTPSGEPPYIAGPHPGLDLAAGTYAGIVAFTLPAAATDVASETPWVAAGNDGEALVVASRVTISAGASQEVVVRFRLPDRIDALALEPSARLPSVPWSVPGGVTDDGGTRLITLQR